MIDAVDKDNGITDPYLEPTNSTSCYKTINNVGYLCSGDAQNIGQIYTYGGSSFGVWSSNSLSGLDTAIFGAGGGNTASGNLGTVFGGYGNTASGFDATVIGGNNNTASGLGSTTMGANATDRGRSYSFPRGVGSPNGAGSAQNALTVLWGKTSSTAALRLTADSAAAGSANCVNLPSAGLVYSLTVDVTIVDKTSPAKSTIYNAWTGEIDRPTNAASTHVSMNTTPTPIVNGSMGSMTLSATADTTNACLNLSVTPPSGNSDQIDMAATVATTEVQ